MARQTDLAKLDGTSIQQKLIAEAHFMNHSGFQAHFLLIKINDYLYLRPIPDTQKMHLNLTISADSMSSLGNVRFKFSWSLKKNNFPSQASSSKKLSNLRSRKKIVSYAFTNSWFTSPANTEWTQWPFCRLYKLLKIIKLRNIYCKIAKSCDHKNWYTCIHWAVTPFFLINRGIKNLLEADFKPFKPWMCVLANYVLKDAIHQFQSIVTAASDFFNMYSDYFTSKKCNLFVK